MIIQIEDILLQTGEQISTGIREATITGQPYPIKGWFIYGTNLMQALPNQR
ncbi:MAG: hypothetical protein MZV64_07895 [Ignavibacteriales bacterium]|nr:hypothetical protein [Ignavibacteriales bacterium]